MRLPSIVSTMTFESNTSSYKFSIVLSLILVAVLIVPFDSITVVWVAL
jgi:hypothetical protein